MRGARRLVNAVAAAVAAACMLLASGCAGLAPNTEAPAAASAAAASIDKPARQRPMQTVPGTPPANPEPRDLWRDIGGALLIRDADHRRVQREIEWFVRNPDYLTRVSERAAPYLDLIVAELRARDLPLDLALLPVIESAYQVKAYSPRHAAGLWQFIPSTARRYGLEQNWWYDGRRDAPAATRAALDLLTALHQRYDGDWLLALAAYNSGEGNVNRALRANRRAGKPLDFFALKLPRETLNYVPRFLALVEVVAEPEKYGQRLTPVAPGARITRIDTGGPLELAAAAGFAGLPQDDFLTLNAGHRRTAIGPNGPFHVYVPLERASSFRAALAALDPADRIRWRRYRIAAGDSLSTIAARHGTSVQALKEVNKLRSSRIRAGRELLVPPAGRIDMAEPVLAGSPAAPAADAGGAQRGDHIVHIVQRGDTLWDLARLYGTSTAAIARLNGIRKNTVLRLNQELKITSQLPDEDNDGRQRVAYEVRRGDSLWTISRRFNVSVEDLQRWNRLSRRAPLRPGQRLDVYVLTASADGV